MAKIRLGTANGRYGRTASAQKKNRQKSTIFPVFNAKKLIFDKRMNFSRESKYEIRVLRVVACVRKFLYTVTQKMNSQPRVGAKAREHPRNALAPCPSCKNIQSKFNGRG